MEIQPEKLIKRNKLPKDTLNIIRTNMRNNIELTHIADNKANVLLSLSALMITFLLPFIIPHLETIKSNYLWIPLTVLVLTCFVTIYLSGLVLKPSKFYKNQSLLEKGEYVSPFFFGNFYTMSKDEFADYIKPALLNEELVKDHVIEDLHFIGSRLGYKMTLVRMAFNLFTAGFFLAVTLGIILLFLHP